MTDSVHHLRYTVSLINSCWTLTLEFTEFGQKSQNQSRHYETEEMRFCVLLEWLNCTLLYSLVVLFFQDQI